MPLTTSVFHDGGVALLAVAGELDLAVVGRVDAAVEQVLADGLTLLLVDLDGLQFCDSSGLGALLRASRRVEAAGGTCVVAGARGAVERLMALTGMDQAMHLVPDVQPALAALRAASSDATS